MIENVNVIIATYFDEKIGDVQIQPQKGNVAFGSGLHGWAFTLRQFAKRYATKVTRKNPLLLFFLLLLPLMRNSDNIATFFPEKNKCGLLRHVSLRNCLSLSLLLALLLLPRRLFH